MPGCINHIDFHAFKFDRNIFCEDRDTPFLFQVTTIEYPLALELGLAELSALPEQAIDQCRFAVVDMSNDDEVADLFWIFGHGSDFSRRGRKARWY